MGGHIPKLDPNALPDPSVIFESFEHPQHGYLDYDPHTLAIHQPISRKPISWPIGLPGRFFGTKQPHVPTCSEPVAGNLGCPKWHGCPLKAFPHVGPGAVIASKRDAVTLGNCYDFFSERDVKGRLIYQLNLVEHGWKLATDRTTIPVMGSSPVLNAFGQKTGEINRGVWQKDVPDLLPFWWPLLRKQGKPLPEAAKHYPQLAEDDAEEPSTQTSGSAEPQHSSSPGGARGQTPKTRAKSVTASARQRSAPRSSALRGRDA